jgi:hypothetical protein
MSVARFSLSLVWPVAMVVFLSAPSYGAVGPSGLPDCAGRSQVRPSRVVLSCAGGAFAAVRVVWRGWGSPQAVGTGSTYVNDCTPSCASGSSRRYPIVLIASGAQRCPDGSTAYQQVSYASTAPMASLRTLTVQQIFLCR